mgnify:CR=1 FL=1
MNLEQVIHQRWAASDTLNALLPAENVKTGRSLDGSTPYATIARLKSRTRLRTNAGDALDELTLRICVWHDEYDAGRAVAEEVKAAFDRSAFTLAGGDRVVQMLRSDDFASQHDDGLWQFTTEFLVQVYLSSGT